jgi:hypothetical protein
VSRRIAVTGVRVVRLSGGPRRLVRSFAFLVAAMRAGFAFAGLHLRLFARQFTDMMPLARKTEYY